MQIFHVVTVQIQGVAWCSTSTWHWPKTYISLFWPMKWCMQHHGSSMWCHSCLDHLFSNSILVMCTYTAEANVLLLQLLDKFMCMKHAISCLVSSTLYTMVCSHSLEGNFFSSSLISCKGKLMNNVNQTWGMINKYASLVHFVNVFAPSGSTKSSFICVMYWLIETQGPGGKSLFVIAPALCESILIMGTIGLSSGCHFAFCIDRQHT